MMPIYMPATTPFKKSSPYLHRFLLCSLVLVMTLMGTSCSEDDITGTEKTCQELLQKKDKEFTVKTTDFDGVTELGGKMIGYFNKKNKIEIAVAKSSTMTKGEELTFFYEDEALLAVYQTTLLYNAPKFYTADRAIAAGDSVWFDEEKSTKKLSRYYFYHDRMVKWYNDSSQLVSTDDKRYYYTNKRMLADASKVLQILHEAP